MELYRFDNYAKEKELSCEFMPANKYEEEGTPLPKTCNLCANSRTLHMVDSKLNLFSYLQELSTNSESLVQLYVVMCSNYLL